MSNKTNAAILIAAGAVFAAVVLTVTAVASASRNSSGTMSAANGPYVAGTVINPTTINSRYSDIESEITDSLSRSGKGGMTAPLRGADGTVALPAYSYTSDTSSGSYRIGAGDLGWAISGVKKLELTATAFTVNLATALRVDGATVAPGFASLYAGAAAAAPTGSNYSLATNGSTVTQINSPSGGVFLGVNNSATFSVTSAGTTIGASGTAISGSFANSTAWTPGAVGAGTTLVTTITVTGAAAGAPCSAGPPPSPTIAPTCAVTLNTCSISLFNPTAAPITGTSGTYSCRVWNP